jgi:ABC-type spermidine/putrescine transport system permease subunit I
LSSTTRSSLSRVVPSTALPLTVVLTSCLVLPVAVFFVYGFWTSDLFGIHKDWNLGQYRSAVSGFYLEILAKTLATATIVAAVVVALAYIAAFVVTFKVKRRRNLLVFLIVASSLTSYLVRIYSWKAMLGPQGLISTALEWLGLIGEPATFLLYNRASVSIALVQILIPFAFLPIYAAMQAVDRDLLNAARDLGASGTQTFTRVLWPLTSHGAAYGFAFAFIIAGGDYVTPEMLGGKSGVMTGRIINDQFGLTQNFSLASALAFVLLAGFLVVLLALNLLRAQGHRLRLPLPSRPQRRPPAGASRRFRSIWGPLFLGAILIYLYVPLLAVLALSVNDSTFSSFPIRGFTLEWYGNVLGPGPYRSAFVTSINVASIVTVLAIAIGIPSALALARRSFTLRPVLLLALLACLGLPGIIIGFSIFSALREIGEQPSLVSVVAGQLIVVLPFVVLTLMARLQRMDPSLEEAGRDLGCTPLGVFRRITAPLIVPVVIGAAVISFAISMDEFVVTHFTVGDRETFPVLIWAQLHRRGLDPSVNAAASVLVVSTLALLVILALFSRSRRGRDAARSLIPLEGTKD